MSAELQNRQLILSCYNEIVYVSCPFGLHVTNMIHWSREHTWFIGPGNTHDSLVPGTHMIHWSREHTWFIGPGNTHDSLVQGTHMIHWSRKHTCFIGRECIQECPVKVLMICIPCSPHPLNPITSYAHTNNLTQIQWVKSLMVMSSTLS